MNSFLDRPFIVNIMRILTVWVFTCIIFGAGLFIYWFIWPYTPLVVENCPIEIVNPNKIVKAGDILWYKLVYTKPENLNASTSKQLINNIIIQLTNETTNMPIGIHKSALIWTYIPKEVPLGEYHLQLTVTYSVNPVRDVVLKFVTEKFRVVK